MRAELVLAFAAMTVATYFSRAFFTLSVSRVRLSPLGERYLSFIPFAVLTAIVTPYLLLPGHGSSLSLFNPWIIAGGLTLFVSCLTKNLIFSVVCGVGMFLVLGRVF